ncbi:MAG: hypothetical protein WC197_05455, partial [Candidatus Gastranaerophilaceae bacterium]
MENILKSKTGLFLFALFIFCLLTIFWMGLASEVYFSTYGAVLNIIESGKFSINGFNLFSNFVKFLGAFVVLVVILNLYNILDTFFSYYSYNNIVKNYKVKKYRLREALARTFSWSYFRTGYILGPQLLVTLGFSAFFVSSFLFFNYFTELAGYSIGAATFISVFIFLMLFFLFCACAILSAWRHSVTFYGFECSLSEPDLTNEQVTKRSEKLFFSSLWNAILYITNVFYIVALFYQVYKYITFPSFVNFENIPNIIILISINLFFISMLQYFKTKMYVRSLLNYYDKITFS